MTCAVCGSSALVMVHRFIGGGRAWEVTAPLYFASSVPAAQETVTPLCGAACSLALHERMAAA